MMRNEGSTPRKTPRQSRSRATLGAILEAVAYILAALITELRVAMSRKAGPPSMRPSPTRHRGIQDVIAALVRSGFASHMPSTRRFTAFSPRNCWDTGWTLSKMPRPVFAVLDQCVERSRSSSLRRAIYLLLVFRFAVMACSGGSETSIEMQNRKTEMNDGRYEALCDECASGLGFRWNNTQWALIGTGSSSCFAALLQT
jgi:hypothetical protein